MTLDSLKGWCDGKLSGYKIRKKLAVLESLTRNAMGKVMKPSLKALLENRSRIIVLESSVCAQQ